MRSILAMLALAALAACGPSSNSTGAASVPPWRTALTDHPQILRPYSPAQGLAALSGSRTSPAGNDAVTIATSNENGAWSAMLVLGPDATAPTPTALRVTAHVNRGALHLLSTYDHAPSSYAPYKI